MSEAITKATQDVNFVVDNLTAAIETLRGKPRADGMRRLLSLEERCAAEYLAECLELARKLQGRLLMVSDE